MFYNEFMTQAPIDAETSRGYEPPQTTQFSVFLANRIGKLHELLEAFEGDPALRVVALSVVEAADHAVVRVVTNHAGSARRLLRDRGLPFSEAEILIVELGSDQRLGRLCMILLAVEISIHYAYPLMVRPHGAATIALHTDDQVLAGTVLRRKGFGLLGEADLREEGGGGAGPYDQAPRN